MNENFTREQVLKAVAAAWDDANANRHGNPFVALEAVLAALGMSEVVKVGSDSRVYLDVEVG
jgi:hypothetical protein